MFDSIHLFAGVAGLTSWFDVLFLFFSGIIAGVLSAIFGVGGGFLFTPLFHTWFHFSAVNSVATSMAQIPFTTLSGLIKYLRKINIQYKEGFTMLAGALPASQAAVFTYKWTSRHLSDTIVYGTSTFLDLFLAIAFTFLLFSMGVYTIINNRREKPETEPGNKKTSTLRTLIWGIAVGLVSGFFGVGGGFLAVPYFIYVCGYTPAQSSATSLFIIFPVAFLSTLHFWSLDQVIVAPALVAAIGGIMGAQLGAQISLKTKEKRLKVALGFFQLGLGGVYLFTKILMVN
ncbi:MAG: sulfite exporter TauE/SafE family protein [Leptospirales bacterium]